MWTDDEEEALANAAASGDMEAAAALIQDSHSLLTAMARRLASDVMDPDDLLSESLVRLFTLWASGAGPRSHVASYLVQVMRNRVRDELRSPRSRVSGLPDGPDEPSTEMDVHLVDIDQERQVVRRALERIPESYRQALLDTAVEQRKQSELAVESGRSVSAMHVLVHRSKSALRRGILQELMERSPRRACAVAADRLPRRLPITPDAAPEDPAFAHIRTCPECQRAWRRYLSLAALALIAPFVMFESQPPTSAQASEMERPHRAGGTKSPGAVSRVTWSKERLVHLVVATPGRVAAIALTAVGAGALVAGAAIGYFHTTDTAGLNADLRASITDPSPEWRRVVEIELDAGGDADSAVVLTVSFPDNLSLISTSPEWDCETNGENAMTCRIDGAVDGSLEFEEDRMPREGGEVRIDAAATVGPRSTQVAGWARLPITDDGEQVSARLKLADS